MNPATRALRAACALVALVLALPVLAQARDAAARYPDRPVRLVVPFGAGSGPDVRTRQLGQKLAEAWGQSVIVENRPGAGGQLAMEQVARAAPDGYTLVMAGQSPMAIAPHLAKLRYDPLKDFAPVTRTSKGAIVLVVNPQLPVRTVAELVEHASRNPDRLHAASWGTATVTHLALELFTRAVGVRITHVPYRAAAQAVGELVAGEVQLAFDFYPAIGPQVKAGRLRAIAVSGRERLPALPEVPTFTEAGVREMETLSGWQGVAAPARTPRAIVDRIQAAVARALALPDVRASYTDSGFDTVGDTPEEFAAFIRAEYARWGKVIAEAGIRVE
ncbi:MAG: tripartite tricarboxylate transporter substrate binding protein [Burkholderiales bacterium]|nr:tripartite tricarboxylate transporter substrate binding protein [Burkholderiales bacterium]